MDIQGHGYIRPIAGVDAERQFFDLRILFECKGFRLRGPVIVDSDGREFVFLLQLVECPETAGLVFVPHMRHLSESLEMVRLYVPVCSVQP